jgi:hypothetical protein
MSKDVEVERKHKELRHLSVQESRAPTPDREEALPLNPSKYHQQCEVTMPREYQNQNGKRNIKMKVTRKEARKFNKKKEKIEKLQKVPEGTVQKEGFHNLKFVGISVQHSMELHHGK